MALASEWPCGTLMVIDIRLMRRNTAATLRQEALSSQIAMNQREYAWHVLLIMTAGAVTHDHSKGNLIRAAAMITRGAPRRGGFLWRLSPCKWRRLLVRGRGFLAKRRGLLAWRRGFLARRRGSLARRRGFLRHGISMSLGAHVPSASSTFTCRFHPRVNTPTHA